MIMAGKLRHVADFEERITVKDASGETVEQWKPIGRAMVSIQPRSIDAQSEDTTNYQYSSFELTARYSPKIEKKVTTNSRVKIADKYYQIDEIGDVFSRKQLTYLVSLYE